MLNKRQETCDLHVKIILHPRVQCCRVPEWTDVANFNKHSCSIPEIIEENTRTTMKLISSSCGWRVPGNLVWNWEKKKVFILYCLHHSERWRKRPTAQIHADDAKADFLLKSTCCRSSVCQEVAQVNEILHVWADSIAQSNLEGVWGPSIPVRGIPRIQTREWGHVGRSDSHDELWLWPTIRERAAKPRRGGGRGGGGQTRGFSLC